MKTFLIQVEKDGTPSYDFCYGLMISKRYYEWTLTGHGDFIYQFYETGDIKVENPDDCIPVGSIEFVEAFVKTNYGPGAAFKLVPFYPECWAKKERYLGDMKIANPYGIAANMNTYSDPNALHVKSALKLKDENNGNWHYNDIVKNKEIFNANASWYVGKCIYPISEWRIFVHDNVCYGVKNYNGSPWITPNEDTVKKMINEYEQAYRYDHNMSKTYTLDVGISPIDNSTKIVEYHEFYSCGLYGFDLYEMLPYMFSKQWVHVLRRIKGS